MMFGFLADLLEELYNDWRALAKVIGVLATIVAIFKFFMLYIYPTFSEAFQPYLPTFILINNYLKSSWTIGALQSAIYVYIYLMLFTLISYIIYNKFENHDVKNTIFDFLVIILVVGPISLWILRFFPETSSLDLAIFFILSLVIPFLFIGLLVELEDIHLEDIRLFFSKKKSYQELKEVIWEYISIFDNLNESRKFLKKHPELLGEEAESLLEREISIAVQYENTDLSYLTTPKEKLEDIQNILQICRTLGPEEAFKEIQRHNIFWARHYLYHDH